MNRWWVYVISTDKDGSGELYIGISTDVESRVKRHSCGLGAKRTRGRGTWYVIAKKGCENRSEASRIEYRLKRLTRERKIDWCKSGKESREDEQNNE